MTCSGVVVAVAARSVVASVGISADARRELYASLYYFITLAVPIALIVGIVWASPWSRYGRK